MTYALALDNPPLLVVCDTRIIQIHTHFTNAPSEVYTIALQDIAEPPTSTNCAGYSPPPTNSTRNAPSRKSPRKRRENSPISRNR